MNLFIFLLFGDGISLGKKRRGVETTSLKLAHGAMFLSLFPG
jgi:hypothetical protein